MSMNNFHLNPSDSMRGYLPSKSRVIQLLIQKTNGYQDQFLRPYTAMANQGLMDSIISKSAESFMRMGSMAADNSRTNVSTIGTAISQYANQFLTPSGSVEGKAHITGGWNQQRCRFTLTVDHETFTGGTSRSIVYGYTDLPGVSNLTGLKWTVDENMVFYINSIVDVGHQRYSNNGGQQDRYFAVDHKSVLSDLSPIGTQNRKTVITPDSTLNKMAYNEITAADYGSGGMMVTENTTDTIIPGKEKVVSRSDSVASNFVSKALVSYVSSINSNGYDSFEASNYSNAAAKSNLNIQATENFIRAMKTASAGATGVMFTLRDLMMFDANCTNSNVLHVAEPNVMGPSAGMTSQWHASDLTTALAYMIAQTVPSVMISNNITQLDFIASNETIDGTTSINISLMRTIFTVMMQESVLRLKVSEHLSRELSNALSAHNTINYFLKVSCSITGDCQISLRIGSDPVTDFVCPVYADNTYSINTTYNGERLDQVATGLQHVINETAGALQHANYNANSQVFTSNFNSIAQPFANHQTATVVNTVGGF